MKFTRTHAAILFVLAIVVGMLTLRFSGPSQGALAERRAPTTSDDQTARPRDRDQRALANEVESLRAEVEALRVLIGQQRAAGNARAAPEEDALPNEAEQQEIWDEYVSLAEAGFNEEPTDARWASELSATIQREIADQPALRGTTKALECRSRSCKVELRDDGSAAFSSQLPQLVDELGAQISSAIFDVVEDAQGGRTQVMYLSRSEPNQAAHRSM